MPTPAVDFMTEDFLLQNDFARLLYHQYAKKLPIIDYHCHLSPADIAGNRQFEDISAIWLAGDHYKWRAMRTLGIDEKYITGNGTSPEKFSRWAFTVPFTMRNPLYHWTHLELKRYFGISALLNNSSADAIYAATTEKINSPGFRVRPLITSMNVETICTTDDPTDDLAHHRKIREEKFAVKVLPAFRPDKAYAVENPSAYADYLEQLSVVSGIAINQFEDLLLALENRIGYFHEQGCRLSDHGLEHMYYFADNALDENVIFKKILSQQTATVSEIQFFKYKVLLALGRMYHEKGWTQQFHLGALRNTNARMLHVLGPDTGFDSVGDFQQGAMLAGFMNALDSTDQLAKTILYNLNPRDNEVMGTMIGNFNDGSVKGKIQFGSAWWFLDQKDGMEKQINALSNLGLLSCFIGMLTDSRSFLSYPRHEYFRRILCNLIGKDVAQGELPADERWLGKLVEDICYHNAHDYFKF